MEALRLELLPFGIFVCNLEPSFLKTGTTQLSVQMASGGHSFFAGPRKEAHDRAVAAGERGLPLDRVATSVERIIVAKRPQFRISVDGFVTKLGIMRFLTPEMIFERIVIRQTSPELLKSPERGSS